MDSNCDLANGAHSVTNGNDRGKLPVESCAIEAVELEKPEFILKEWNPQTNLLAKIPVKAQKGFTTLDLTLTCIAALPEFLVLGTNVGLIYWYNRKTGSLERLKIEHATNPVTCICVVSSVDYMLAAGNKDGVVNIFQIPKYFDAAETLAQPNGNKEAKIPKKKQVQIFSVKDMHKSAITTLEWSSNGEKLFSGDSAGVITLTEMDYSLGQCKSLPLLDESHEIVQLSYAQLNLVISTTFRTSIYSLESRQITRIGSQERKISGPFGAVMMSGLYNRNRKLYAARPGLRLWVASLDGTVQSTIVFKDLLDNAHVNIPVINPVTKAPISPQETQQFGMIYNFSGKYLVTWHKDILYVLDPENIQVIGSCSELKSIISLGVCQDEIFVLETGRKIIRISANQDPYESLMTSSKGSLDQGDAFIPDPMTASMIGEFRIPEKPLNFLASHIADASQMIKRSSRALPKFNTNIFHTIKNVIESDLDIQDGQFTVLPQVIPLKAPNVPDITIETSTSPNLNPAEKSLKATADKEKFDRISKQTYEDVVLAEFKPEVVNKKKGGKRKRVQDVEALSDSTSLSSHYSSNSEGDINNSATHSTLTGQSIRRKSFLDSSSSCTSLTNSTSATTSNQHSPNTTEEMPNDFIPGIDNVRFYNERSSSTDLESKEQMLAKLLNWTDILPSSNSNHMSDAEQSSIETLQASLGATSERSSARTPNLEDVDSGVVDGSSSGWSGTIETVVAGSGSGSVGTSTGSDEDRGENSDDDNLSHLTDTSSLDIYKRYGQGDTLSLHSNFSFGPPSGSSNMYYTTEESRTSSISGSSGAEDYRRDLGISLGLIEPDANPGDLIEASLVNLGLQDMAVEGISGNDHWIQYKLPTSAAAISVCELYVVCVDNQNSVFFSQLRSDEVSLRWVKTDYTASHISISPSGYLVWRIDNKRVLHSLTFPSQEGPFTVEGEWIQLTENVRFVALEESVGWIVKTDGSVHICKRIKDGLPIPKPYFELVPTQWVVTQLCIFKNHVWALTSDGRLLYRTRVSVVNPVGEEWIEIKLLSVPPIAAFGVGPHESLWLADIQNKIHFLNGRNYAIGAVEDRHLWHVIIADYIFQHGSGNPVGRCQQARHWRNRLVESLRPAHLASFLQSKTVPLLCASKSTVWFTLIGTSSIYINKTAVTGHRWETFTLNSGLKSLKWSDVIASSVYLQHGFLWLTNSKRKLQYCSPSDGKLNALELLPSSCCPYSDPIIHAASAPEALWVLTLKGNIYGRCNMNAKNDLGSGWEKIQLSPFDTIRMIHISCGSEVCWGCDNDGNIYMRLGSLDPPGTNDISPAWVQVERRSNIHQGSHFTKVYVGTAGHMVWALDDAKNIYAREAVFPDLPIGTDWVHVSGIEAVSLAISECAVWALSPKGEIFRRYGISKTNFVGEYWRKIPGTATALTASVSDEIWILDSNGYLLKHYQETQKFNEDAVQHRPLRASDSDDNDWEFIG